MKSPEIQQFQGIFLFPLYIKTCRFRKSKISHSVVFQNPFKKTTICTILHLFSIIYKDIFQVQKSTFADLLECGGKEIGRKEKKTVIPRIRKFPLKSRLLSPANFGGFSRKFRWLFYIVCIKATEKISPAPFRLTK
ncbi:hypothetical protein B5F97_08115 [Bacteroides clarus]|uniref:Uncharacterized protein n=1 Tax=Bacteroides clarus TaxID=626929 RepID=A0A1Y3YTF5_9BACE|nr:hypothetical protein B5F97_08115 [Bacteroides clarus]